MPDLYFFRDPEGTEKEVQTTGNKKAVTKEEFQGQWSSLLLSQR